MRATAGRWLAGLGVALVAIPAPADPAPPAEGILLQRVLVAAYVREDPAERGRLALLEREVRQFEAYLWRTSNRKVRVEATLLPVGRTARAAELEGEDPRWGWALGRSERVDEDLRRAGYQPSRYDGLILLFEPPRGRPCRAAGLTWHRERYSSIPLKENLFEEAGHRYPLHLVMVHEYLHQIDSAFEAAGRAAGFEDPDRVGRAGEAACVLPGDEYPFFRTALQQDETCRPPDWRALDGQMGTWMSR